MKPRENPREKTITVTFSLPIGLNNLLHTCVEKRKLSRFVAHAIEQALESEKQALRDAYAAANKDQDRKEVIEDWSALDNERW